MDQDSVKLMVTIAKGNPWLRVSSGDCILLTYVESMRNPLWEPIRCKIHGFKMQRVGNAIIISPDFLTVGDVQIRAGYVMETSHLCNRSISTLVDYIAQRPYTSFHMAGLTLNQDELCGRFERLPDRVTIWR